MVSDKFTKMDVTPNIVFLRLVAWIQLIPACMLCSPRSCAAYALSCRVVALPLVQMRCRDGLACTGRHLAEASTMKSQGYLAKPSRLMLKDAQECSAPQDIQEDRCPEAEYFIAMPLPEGLRLHRQRLLCSPWLHGRVQHPPSLCRSTTTDGTHVRSDDCKLLCEDV